MFRPILGHLQVVSYSLESEVSYRRNYIIQMMRSHSSLQLFMYMHCTYSTINQLCFDCQLYIIYRVSQEEWTKLRESVPYVEQYRYNPKHLYSKLNGYGDNGHRKVWASGLSTYCTPSVTPYLSSAHAWQPDTASQHRNAVTLAR